MYLLLSLILFFILLKILNFQILLVSDMVFGLVLLFCSVKFFSELITFKIVEAVAIFLFKFDLSVVKLFLLVTLFIEVLKFFNLEEISFRLKTVIDCGIFITVGDDELLTGRDLALEIMEFKPIQNE
jgi:hypothetical protein